MARPTEKDLVAIGPWPSGSNNIANESSIPPGACRSLINGDFYPGGRVRRRSGSTLDQTGSVSGLWSDGHYALCRIGDQLLNYLPGSTPTLVYSGIHPDNPMVYCRVNQYILVSDGVVCLRVDPTTSLVRSWGVPSPTGQPVLLATSAGGLDAGIYQVAITYTDVSGEESGTELAAVVELTQPGGIALSSIPQSTDPCVTAIRIYMTRPNGTQLLRYARVPAGVTSLEIGVQLLDRELETQFLEPLPGIADVEFCAGRVFFATGDMVGWSQSVRLGLWSPADNYLLYPGPVTQIAASSKDSAGESTTGVFVSAGDSIFWLPGGSPAEYKNVPVYDSPAVPGTLVYISGSFFKRQEVPSQEVPVWVAQNGTVCVGLPNGTVLPLTENKFAMSVGASGASILRESDGIRQLLFSMQPPGEVLPIVATDTLVITRVKNGIVQQ
jgi:hypothetical protein